MTTSPHPAVQMFRLFLFLLAITMSAASHAAEPRAATLRAGDAPTFPKLTAVDGKTIDLNALRGKVLVLTYFSVTCPYCMNEAPKLQKLYRENADRLTVVGVSVDGDGAAQKAQIGEWIRKYQLTHPVTADYAALRPLLGRPKGLPVLYLFDRQGKLQKIETGEMLDEDFDDIARFAQGK